MLYLNIIILIKLIFIKLKKYIKLLIIQYYYPYYLNQNLKLTLLINLKSIMYYILFIN